MSRSTSVGDPRLPDPRGQRTSTSTHYDVGDLVPTRSTRRSVRHRHHRAGDLDAATDRISFDLRRSRRSIRQRRRRRGPPRIDDRELLDHRLAGPSPPASRFIADDRRRVAGRSDDGAVRCRSGHLRSPTTACGRSTNPTASAPGCRPTTIRPTRRRGRSIVTVPTGLAGGRERGVRRSSQHRRRLDAPGRGSRTSRWRRTWSCSSSVTTHWSTTLVDGVRRRTRDTSCWRTTERPRPLPRCDQRPARLLRIAVRALPVRSIRDRDHRFATRPRDGDPGPVRCSAAPISTVRWASCSTCSWPMSSPTSGSATPCHRRPGTTSG